MLGRIGFCSKMLYVFLFIGLMRGYFCVIVGWWLCCCWECLSCVGIGESLGIGF